jgi:hypothetical protein
LSEEFESIVQELKGLGFLVHLDTAQVYHAAYNFWGLDLPCEAESPTMASVMIACQDRSRVWHQDLKTYGEEHAYQQLLVGLANISNGRFHPSDIQESPEVVTFRAHGYGFEFRPKPGHYLDMSILKTVNSAIFGKAVFHCSDSLGMPNVSFLATPSVAQALRLVHKWSLVPSATQPQDDTIHGFLSTFWEQGMEEDAWLILQDQRYCDDLNTGWLREGMRRISLGDHLTIFEQDGRTCWQGVLGSGPRTLWERLRSIPPPLFPRDMEESVWKGWFKATPLRRAVLRAISGRLQPQPT